MKFVDKKNIFLCFKNIILWSYLKSILAQPHLPHLHSSSSHRKIQEVFHLWQNQNRLQSKYHIWKSPILAFKAYFLYQRIYFILFLFIIQIELALCWYLNKDKLLKSGFHSFTSEIKLDVKKNFWAFPEDCQSQKVANKNLIPQHSLPNLNNNFISWKIKKIYKGYFWTFSFKCMLYTYVVKISFERSESFINKSNESVVSFWP